MVRLQRVTFLALHNYLGLTTELFNTVPVTLTQMSTCQSHRFPLAPPSYITNISTCQSHRLPLAPPSYIPNISVLTDSNQTQICLSLITCLVY